MATTRNGAGVRNIDQTVDLSTVLSETWSEILGRASGALGQDLRFFDAGGNSLQIAQLHAALQRRLDISFDLMILFEAPTLAGQLARLQPIVDAARATATKAKPAPRATKRNSGRKASAKTPMGGTDKIVANPRDIAIVGLAARLPGVDDLDDFWTRIRAGDNLIPKFRDDEIEDGVDAETRASDAYVPSRPFLKDADCFDARYFDIMPREAEVMDPQARIFLELCAEALDHAALDPARHEDPIGVYAGTTFSTYLLHNLMGDRATLEDYTGTFQIGNYTTMTGNTNDSFAGRVAYKLNLKGPAISIATACSTSLTAIAQACEALRAGTVDAALAGGISVTFPQKRGYVAVEGGMTAPDGVCRPFDADAGGTVFGHGAGVIVLKRLSDALAAGDTIHAVIRGVGITNDGGDKMSYTAPSVAGQAAAIRRALKDATVAPDSISFVECHGTATPLGDPIELRALGQAYDLEPGESCALGSVKGNIGHLATAAGVVGVIKTVLMLRHGEIPPVANFKAPNPRIDIDALPFYVPTEATPWLSDGPRRAGVSSTGIGGTNVHLVLEEPPLVPVADAVPEGVAQILPLSAKSPEALMQLAANLAGFLEGGNAPALGDVAFTLQEGRRTFPWRLAVAAGDPADAATALRSAPVPAKRTAGQAPGVVFLFPGQGSQYPGMGQGLYRAEPAYARWIDRGIEILEPLLDFDMHKALCEVVNDDADFARTLKDTRVTQPALYLVEYATAALLRDKGVTPKVMIGHSVGEFAAAAHAGVFDFETGLRIIAERGRLMQDQPKGAMLAVFAERDALSDHLQDGVELAAMNAPQLQVVAGPEAAITDLEDRLGKAGMSSARLHTSHAFHSAMMDPVIGPLKALVSKMKLESPKLAIQSTVTGAPLTAEEATDPAYWAGQARAAVNFEAAFRAANGTGSDVFVEVGAGRTLSTFARQILGGDSQGRVFQSLPDHTQTIADDQTLAAALGNLWTAGVPIDWSLTGPRGNRRVPLPAYPFQRESYWIEPARAAAPAAPKVNPADGRYSSGTNSKPSGVENAERTLSMTAPDARSRAARLEDRIAAVLSDLSGVTVGPDEFGQGFLDLGFDSLFLTQAARAIGAEFDTRLTVCCLLADHPSVTALASHLDTILPIDAVADDTVSQSPEPKAPDRETPTRGSAEGASGGVVSLRPDPVVLSGGISTGWFRPRSPPCSRCSTSSLPRSRPWPRNCLR